MRILQIAPPWFSVPPGGYGGVERIVARLVDGLVAAGHDVTLLASGGSRTHARLVTVYDDPPSRQLGRPEWEIRHWMRVYAERDAFDVVHDHSSVVGAALATLADGPPIVHTVHGAWLPAVADAYAALPPVLHLVAISHDQARRAPPGVDVAAVVPNGVDLEAFAFREAPCTDAPYLAFVGRACPDKGPEVAVHVARRVGLPLRMALKVNQTDECEYFESVLRHRLARADVDLVLNATAAHVASMLGGARATIAPLAWDEPFGLVLVESQACGTPVVAFARGAAPETVLDGETGFLIPPGDIDRMCAAVEGVDALSRRRCREHVAQRFSIDAMVTGYEALYARLTTGLRPHLRRVARRVRAGVGF